MISRILSWSMLNAFAFILFNNELCIHLLSHTRVLRVHIKIIKFKFIFIQRAVEFFNAFEIFESKFMIQFELVCLKKHVLKKIEQKYRELIHVINKIALEAISKTTTTTMTKFSKSMIRDLNLMMKYLDKNVIERLKDILAQQVLTQMNAIIKQIREILFIFEDKMMTYKQLRSENVTFVIRKKKNVAFLNQFIQWI